MCRPDDFPPYDVKIIYPEPPTESISFTHPDKVMLTAQFGAFFCEFLDKYNHVMEFGNIRLGQETQKDLEKLIDEQAVRLVRIMEGKEGF